MKKNDEEKGREKGFSEPKGEFFYLDSEKLVKQYPALKQSYLVVHKKDKEHHLLVYDHSENILVLRNEVKDILNRIYPEYRELMEETFMQEAMDPEKVAFGIALGMRVYKTYEEAFIHFRGVYTSSFKKEPEIKKRFPLGDPYIPKDHRSLNFIYLAFRDKKNQDQYSFDGFLFSSHVMEILETNYGIIEHCREPEEFNGYLTDAWKLKGRL